MPTCNVLDFSLIQEYYLENISDSESPRNDATNLCCYESLPMTYDEFVQGVTDLYNSSCVRDREFSDYVTQLFTDCLSGSSGSGAMSFTVEGDNGTPFTIVSGDTLDFEGSTGIDIGVSDPKVLVAIDYSGIDSFIMAAGNGTSITVDGANDKLVIYDNDAAEVKYINANQLPGGGTTDVYWSGNSDGSISPSGLTTNVGIGTHVPSEILSVSGNTNISDSLLVSGDTYFGSTVDVGVDAAGYDVTFYGDTSGKHFRWDTSRGSITLPDDVKIEMGTSTQFVFEHDSTTNLINLATNPLIISTGTTNPNGNSVLVINTEEQVGIGTQTGNTTNRLHVSGTSGENPVRIQALQTNEGSLVVLDDSGVLYRSERQSDTISYWSANTDSKSISNSGLTDTKVGVGTHVPDADLTVSATTGFTTYSYAGSAVVSNGSNRLVFSEDDQNAGLSVGDTVIFTTLAGTFTMTINTVSEDGVNVTFTATFGGESGTLTSLQVNSQSVGSQFKVYNDDLISTVPSFEVADGNTFYGGALSGTGNITTTQNLNISGNTTISGDLLVSEYIKHDGDSDTFIQFADDAIGIKVGNEQLITISESPTFVKIGDGGDVDFQVRTNSDDNTLYVEGSTDRVGIGTNAPTVKLDVNGQIKGTTLTSTSNVYVSGNTYFADSTSANDGRLNFGASDDLTIYHDGSNSYIHDSGTGRLNIKGGAGVNIISPADENMATFEGNGAVNLYYNNNLKFETTNTGVLVTGDIKGTTLTSTSNLYITGNTFYEGSISGRSDIQISDAGKLKLGDAGDLEIYHDGSNSYIDDAGTGTIFYRSGTQTFQNAAGSKTMAIFNAANSVDLRYDNSLKFETTDTGILVTGDGKADTLTSTSNLYVTGNTFYEGALSGTGNITTVGGLTVGSDIAMGTNKVTGLGDPTADQDAVTRSYLSSTTAETYAYQYISYFSAVQGANLDGGNWVLPSAGGGISNHTWNNDSGYAGTNDTINSSSFDFPTADTHIAIPIPVDGFLVGFTCNCRNNGAASEARNAGLFVSNSIPPYGTTSDTPMTLRAFGAGDDLGGSSNSKLYKIDGMLGSGSTVPFAVSKDQVILPAMCAYDTDNIQAQCTWTVVLKTSVSGTT
jgi:hypothetical protein